MFALPEDGWQWPGPPGSAGEADCLPQHHRQALLITLNLQALRGEDELQLEGGVAGRDQGGVGDLAGEDLVGEDPGDSGQAQGGDRLATTGGTRNVTEIIRGCLGPGELPHSVQPCSSLVSSSHQVMLGGGTPPSLTHLRPRLVFSFTSSQPRDSVLTSTDPIMILGLAASSSTVSWWLWNVVWPWR